MDDCLIAASLKSKLEDFIRDGECEKPSPEEVRLVLRLSGSPISEKIIAMAGKIAKAQRKPSEN